jgi:FkbM family methyltransferase
MGLVPEWSIRREILRRALGRRPTTAARRKWNWWAAHHPDVFFVQIGANDGRTGDPLARYIDQHGWRGVMVEPVPATFAQLVENRGATPGIELVNAAITDHDGTVSIAVVDSAHPWTTQFASLHSDVTALHRNRYDDFSMHSIDVPCMTFAQLVQDVDQIDVLQVDTEGHDGAILAQVDFARWSPTVVQYEHSHLGVDERKATEERLVAHGYRITSNERDTLALRR